MPSRDTVDRFVAAVEQGAHAQVIADFYTPNASMQENQQAPRVGRDALVENESNVLKRARKVVSTCVRPVFIDGDRVVIRWIFEFEWLDGSTTRMEEIAYQVWDGELIAQERFFYDPVQMRPVKE